MVDVSLMSMVQEECHGHTGLALTLALFTLVLAQKSVSLSIACHATASIQVTSMKVFFFAEARTVRREEHYLCRWAIIPPGGSKTMDIQDRHIYFEEIREYTQIGIISKPVKLKIFITASKRMQ